MEAIVVAVITGGLSLLGVVVSNLFTARRSEQVVETTQAVMESKLEELTREVRAHNNFAQRIPAVEAKIESLERRVERMEGKA